jgi:predicted NBD/HSP70 family sugar kinase
VLARTGRSRRLADRLAEEGVLTAEDVAHAAAMGDGAALEILLRSGRLVGETLAALVNFFNPSLIVIGGGVARASDEYLAAIREVIYARSLPLATRSLAIHPSSLGGLAGVKGAAAMVLDQIFSEELLGRWIHAGRPTELELDAA